MTLRDALLADVERKGVRRNGWCADLRLGRADSMCEWVFWTGDDPDVLTKIAGVLRPLDILATDWEVAT
jgi:hypothetical protein